MTTEPEDELRDCAPGEVPRTWIPLDDRENPASLRADSKKAAKALWELVLAHIRGEKR
jgi:hypothetical protein